MAVDLQKLITVARDAGRTDDEIVALVKRAKESEAPPPAGRMGRGDELFQADPSPRGAEVNLERPGLVNVGGFGESHGLDVNKPETQRATALDRGVTDLRTGMAALGTGEAAAGLVGSALPAASGAIGRIGAAAAQGAAGGGVGAATDSALRGEGGGDVAKAAGSGALAGGAVGGGAATVGEMLAGAGRAVRNSKGGAARALIEKFGGNVSPTDSGSGIPELNGLKTVTDADIGAQARASGKRLLQANDQMFDAEGRQPYKAATAQVDQGAGQRLVDVTPVRQKMLEVAYDKSTDPGTKAWLLNQADIIEKMHTGPMGVNVMSEKDINGLKSMLWQSANPGLAPGAGSVRDAKIGSVAQIAQSIADQGPYAPANQAYAAAKTRSGDFRESFGMARKPAANEQVDERRIANALARRGQTTTTAGIQGGDQRLAQLEQANPALARDIAGPALVKAKGDLQFGLGHTGGLIDRMPSKHLLVDIARQNIPAMSGRFAYGPAGAVQVAGQGIASAAQQAAQAAAIAQQQKKARDAQVVTAIFGAGRGKPGPNEKQPAPPGP